MSSDWFELSPRDFLSRWYHEEYEHSTYGGHANLIQRWMHRSIERDYSALDHFSRTLELGANRGEHLPFVNHSYDTYTLSDISDISSDAMLVTTNSKLEFMQADAANVPVANETFDRVLHTCLLHHVQDPDQVLSEIRRVLKPGGTADIFVPCDPGLLFRFARWAGPIQTAKRKGLGSVKRLVDARDHRNHIGSLQELIRHQFRNDSVSKRAYPVVGLTWNSALWFTYRIQKS